MKPLFRFTIGPVASLGFEILACSITNLRRIYPDFDIMITYNGLNVKQKMFIRQLGVQTYKQTGEELPITPSGVSWKLYPPRFRLNSHEIVVDNDVLLLDRLEEIDSFLRNNIPLICEDRYTVLGNFTESVRKNFKDDKRKISFNSGIYGLPPGFDFEQKIKSALSNYAKLHNINKWLDKFDEQGLVTKILSVPPFITIPLEKLNICGTGYTGSFRNLQGVHFIGVNRNKAQTVWQNFKHSRRNKIAML